MIDGTGRAAELLIKAILRLQRLILGAQQFCFSGTCHQQEQTLRLKWFFDKIRGSTPNGGDGGIQIAMAGDHKNRLARIAAFDFIKQIQPVEARPLQKHVKEHERGTTICNGRKRRITVRCGPRRIAFILQHAGDEITDICLIIDDQNVECHGLVLLVTRQSRGKLVRRRRCGMGLPCNGRS